MMLYKVTFFADIIVMPIFIPKISLYKHNCPSKGQLSRDYATPIMNALHMKVRFDQFSKEQDSHDYSTLRRITWRSALMGVLVSMGGLM